LESGAASSILKAGKEAVREAAMSAYLDVLLRANPEAFLEAWRMANSTKTFEEVFTEAGIIPQWIEQGKEAKARVIALNLLAKGWTAEEVAETTDLSLEKVHSLVID
jgi:predicted transposase YdaD